MIILRELIEFKFFRYLISGGTAAAVYLALVYVLTDLAGVWYLASTTIGFVVAFLVSFSLQKLWTFKDSRIHVAVRQLALFLSAALAGLFFNALCMYVLVEYAGIWYLLAQVISSGALATISFFVYSSIFHGGDKRFILVATPLYPPDIGGPATYTKIIEEELPKYGIPVRVLPFRVVRSFPKIFRHALFFFLTLFEGSGARVIYAQDPVSVGLPALLASRMLRATFIVKVVGDYAWEQYSQMPDVSAEGGSASGGKGQMFLSPEEFQRKKFDIVTEVRRKIEHYVAGNAKTVIVPSAYLKRIVSAWGVPEERIRVIYNAFNPLIAALDKRTARERLGVDGTMIFSAGRLVPWKGFEALIEVVSQLKKDFPDIRLYIAGDGPAEKDLRFKISDLRMENTVILTGRLQHDKLMEFVRAADVFVLNTGYEGFSHQLLEVMAFGTPVITTNIGGNPELIEDQKEGILVPYNDKEAIKRATELLLRDEALRDILVRNASEKVKVFSKEKMLRELGELLKQST